MEVWMENAQILEQLTAIIRDALDDQTLAVTLETSAADVPAWDSLAHINIVVATEMGFGIKFRTAELEQIRNVGEFVALIDRKLKAKQA
jgi:acyl carrier protein